MIRGEVRKGPRSRVRRASYSETQDLVRLFAVAELRLSNMLKRKRQQLESAQDALNSTDRSVSRGSPSGRAFSSSSKSLDYESVASSAPVDDALGNASSIDLQLSLNLIETHNCPV